jgi:branched-chain amino acid transport system ATP-binding protein
LERAPVRNAASGADALAVRGLRAGYGRKLVVFDVDIHVGAGEIVALAGHNGAGKTTTLKAIFGILPPAGGSISYFGSDRTRASPRSNVIDGMSLIPAERFVFGDLTVRENLLLGGWHVRSAGAKQRNADRAARLFPILRERESQRAGTMSGGEQRMLSLGIALMSEPRLLLLDEPSLGLGPAIVLELFDTIRLLAEEEGLSVLLLEQNIGQALRIADRFYAMRNGRIILEETAALMRRRHDYWDLF